MKALRFDVSGRYAVAVSADGKRLGFVRSSQEGGISAMLTDRPPDDLDVAADAEIEEMTKERVKFARYIAEDPSLGAPLPEWAVRVHESADRLDVPDIPVAGPYVEHAGLP